MTSKIFKIVLLENHEEDAKSIADELRKSEVKHELIKVTDKDSFQSALIEHQPDLVLAEAIIPGMKMNEAMSILSELSPKSSIILLTVSVDRELTMHKLLQDPQKYLDTQRLTKLNAAIKTSLDILRTTEELNRMDKELKGNEALLSAALESTADGILVVNNEGKIVNYNQKFLKMWKIPKDILDSGEDDKALSFVLNQLKDPERFLKRVNELYAEPDAESYDIFYFKDGKIFERLSKPQKIEGKTVGRVWSFRDITERKLAEDALREREADLNRAQKIGKVGSWNLNVATGKVKWSEECYRIFGKDPAVYKPSREGFLASVHPDDLEEFRSLSNDAFKYGKPFNSIQRILLHGGEVRYIHNVTDVTLDEKGSMVGVIGTVRDITEEKLKDEQIKTSLGEKEMMLREIHHRVKNNLQIISSLLKLQSLNTKDPDASEHLRISMNRVRTMAMIHEKLYRSVELSHIEFGDYIKQLAAHIFASYGVKPNTLQLNVKAKNVHLDIDTAVPCGLLINEVVSNSLKHAFPDNNHGLIEIELSIDKDGKYNLIISDDGIGMPEGTHPVTSNSLGLKLINTLAKQLGSEMTVTTDNGTNYYLKFPPIIYPERK